MADKKSKIRLTIKKDIEWGQYVVAVYVNDVYSEGKSNYSDDLQDAKDTRETMAKWYREKGHEVEITKTIGRVISE